MTLLSCQSLDPQNVSQEDIMKIFAIEQDMWWREQWLWAYVHCDSCDQTFSKQDIYKNKVSEDVYLLLVSEIEESTESEFLSCLNCQKKVTHVFEKETYIDEIRHRYSGNAMLTVMYEDEWDIVGFMDGHISGFDNLFERDLSYRYPKQYKETIQEAIKNINDGILPDIFFSCSSMWTKEKYMHFSHIYYLLQSFFQSFPTRYENEMWISELHSWGALDKIYKHLWSESLGIADPWGSLWTDSYNSWLYIQRRLGKRYKRAFQKPLRRLLSGFKKAA